MPHMKITGTVFLQPVSNSGWVW